MSLRKDKLREEILEKVVEYYKEIAHEKLVSKDRKIDPSGKLFDENELINGVEAVLDCWWTEGRFAAKFRKKFGEYLGIKNVTLTNSGSSANLVAFYSLTSSSLGERRIKPGDEVITVAASFPTTINPIIQYGAIPVLLDLEDITLGRYNADVSKLEEAITDKTKAIFLAHTLGNPFDLSKVLKIKEDNNLWLIEDCCDALGSEYEGQKVGTFGDLATFSFYPAHHITMGEGGAVVTNSSESKKLVESFRNWGRDCWCEPGKDNTCGKRFDWHLGDLPYGYDHKNIYTHSGFNVKPSDMQAAIGLAQLDKLDFFIKKRRENFDYLKGNLSKYTDQIILPDSLPVARPSWFGFLISVRENASFSRNELETYLTENLVLTRPLFCGNITKQPYFKDVKYRTLGTLKNSDYVMNNTLWVGVQPNITEERRARMVDTFERFFRA